MRRSLRFRWLPLALIPVACATPHGSTSPESLLAAPVVHSAPQDYSPQAMFQERHADFIVRADRYRPMTEAHFSARPSASLENEPGEFDVTEYGFSGRVPLVTDPDSYVLVGGQFHSRRYEFSSAVRGGVQDETVYGLGLLLGYGTFLTNDTRLELEFEPGVFSDFEGSLKTEDWAWYAKGLVTFKYSEELYLKGGIRNNNDFKDAPILPMAGLSWLFLPEWRLDILLPESAEVTWNPTTATFVHAGIELHGSEYHVRSSLSTGKARSDIRVQEIDLYLGMTHRLDDRFALFGRVGTSIAGDHEFRGPTGIPVNGNLDPTFMFEVGIGFDF